MKKNTKLAILMCILSSFNSHADGTLKVMQFNLHNAVFEEAPDALSPNARAEAALMNQGKYDLIMTQENSTPNQSPRNLLNYGLNSSMYAICGNPGDATLFYNKNRWRCKSSKTFNVTGNAGFGAGPRTVTVGLLDPIDPQKDPSVLAATSHWCIDWSYLSGHSYCDTPDHSALTAHKDDVNRFFAPNMQSLMANNPNALVIFGGDLNSMSKYETNLLVKDMDAKGYLVANRKVGDGLEPSMGTGTPDLIFYRATSSNGLNKLTLVSSELNTMNGLSDHSGAIIALFNYSIRSK